jgi:hypothetical protein
MSIQDEMYLRPWSSTRRSETAYEKSVASHSKAETSSKLVSKINVQLDRDAPNVFSGRNHVISRPETAVYRPDDGERVPFANQVKSRKQARSTRSRPETALNHPKIEIIEHDLYTRVSRDYELFQRHARHRHKEGNVNNLKQDHKWLELLHKESIDDLLRSQPKIRQGLMPIRTPRDSLQKIQEPIDIQSNIRDEKSFLIAGGVLMERDPSYLEFKGFIIAAVSLDIYYYFYDKLRLFISKYHSI